MEIVIIIIFCIGISNTSRVLNIKHIGSLIPGKRIRFDNFFTVVENVGTAQLEKV
jgi:hypothetical protein